MKSNESMEMLALTGLFSLFSLGIAGAGERLVADFSDKKVASLWRSVNDSVMGGVSKGSFSVTDQQTLEFAGSLSLENRGGFASIRTEGERYELAGYEGMRIRVRGDGRPYRFNLRTNLRLRATSYRVKFRTTAGVWQEFSFPFSAFEATAYGRPIPGAGPLDPAKIRSIGFTIADKKEGPFKLEIDWIQALEAMQHGVKQGAAACKLIERAVEQGVPLYNGGNADACTAIYTIAAQTLVALEAPVLTQQDNDRLTSALQKVGRIDSIHERAWLLRRALDAAYESLRARHT